MKETSGKLLIICLILVFSLTGCSNQEDSTTDLISKVETEIEYLNKELIDFMNKLNNISFSTYMLETQEISPNNENNSSGNSKQGGSGGDENAQTEGEAGSTQDTQQSGNSGGSSKKINVTEMVKEPTISADYDNVQWAELETSIETFASSWNTIILDLYKININGTDITDFSTQLDNLILGIKNQDKTASLNSAASLYSYIPKYTEAYSNQSYIKDISYTKLHVLNSYVGASAR